MLTDKQLQKIREEEIFRQEVRNQLLKKESAPSKVEKFWGLLNSAIVLWFLSTVAVGTLTFSYQKWDEKRLLNRSRQETIRKLDLEISSRLRFFNNQLQTEMLNNEALLILENPSKSDFPSGVFPEYKERSLRALLWELNSIVPEKSKNKISLALLLAGDLGRVFIDLENPHEEMSLDLKLPKPKVDPALDGFFGSIDEGGGKSNTSGINKEELSKHDIESFMDLSITIDKTEIRSRINLYIAISSFNLKRWGYPFKTLIEKLEKASKDKKDETTNSP